MRTSRDGEADARPGQESRVTSGRPGLSWGSKVVTWVHPADLLDEGLIEARDNSAAYGDQEVLVQALHEGVDPPDSSALTKQMRTQTTCCPLVADASTTPTPASVVQGCGTRGSWTSLWLLPYLLDQVHALGRLHAVRVVDDVRDVVLGADGGQFLQPRSKNNHPRSQTFHLKC